MTTLVLGAAGGLIYGAATCDFPGCKAAFGVPLLLGATFALLLVGGD